MDAVGNLIDTRSHTQKKIVLVATAILAVMILFPPKVVTTTLFGQSATQSAGYQFILSNPTVVSTPFGDMANPLSDGGINWVRLIVQIVVVLAAAYAASRFLAKSESQAQ
jgi:predicted permease